jgi:hypothetical protein
MNDFETGVCVGYLLGHKADSGGTIISKTITKNGTYHAADDNADGFDPVTVNVRGLSQKDADDLIQWVIDQIKPQLPDGTEITPPTIDVDSEFKPSMDGADWPYLTAISSDGEITQVMYGVFSPPGAPYKDNMVYYVDTYRDGQLVLHKIALRVPDYGKTPGNMSSIQSDGYIKVVSTSSNGTVTENLWGPNINAGYTTVWTI